MGEAADLGLTGRGIFLLVASAVFAIVLFTAVVRPALERGGSGELIGVAVVFAAILFFERWLRRR